VLVGGISTGGRVVCWLLEKRGSWPGSKGEIVVKVTLDWPLLPYL
jgi:hypothetical protein